MIWINDQKQIILLSSCCEQFKEDKYIYYGNDIFLIYIIIFYNVERKLINIY